MFRAISGLVACKKEIKRCSTSGDIFIDGTVAFKGESIDHVFGPSVRKHGSGFSVPTEVSTVFKMSKRNYLLSSGKIIAHLLIEFFPCLCKASRHDGLCRTPVNVRQRQRRMEDSYENIEILIQGGTLLPMTAPGEIIENPSIGIQNGRIIFVEKADNVRGLSLKADTILDASGCIVMPGLINVHTHLAMTCFRGLADDLPLMAWLNDYIFPAEQRFINAETVYECSLLGMAELILSGTTTFCDGYFFEDMVGEAAMTAGIRGVIAQGFLDFETPDRDKGSDLKKAADDFVKRWLNRSPLLIPSLICHSAYTCSAESMQTISRVAREAKIPFQIHLAETRDEVALLKERYGKSPVEYLNDLGILDEHMIAAHCIWLDKEEIEILAQNGVKVAHDPESNMKLGAGVAPVPEMLSRGIDIGLGTDGCASNNDLDLFGEMAMAARLHKVFSGDPTVLTARQIVEMATTGGARVLGIADRVGSIAPGKEADIILVDAKKPHLTPLYNPFSQLVYAARGADVVTSIINGRIVMKDRHLYTIDIENVMKRVRQMTKSVKETQ